MSEFKNCGRSAHLKNINIRATDKTWNLVHLSDSWYKDHCSIEAYFLSLTYHLQNYSALHPLSIETIYGGSEQECSVVKCRSIKLTTLNLGSTLRWLKGIWLNGFWINSPQQHSDSLLSHFKERFCLRSVPWDNFREQTLKKIRELNRPNFGWLLFASFY